MITPLTRIFNVISKLLLQVSKNASSSLATKALCFCIYKYWMDIAQGINQWFSNFYEPKPVNPHHFLADWIGPLYSSFPWTIYQAFMDHQDLETTLLAPGSYIYWQKQWHFVVNTPTGFFCATPFGSFLKPSLASNCCSPLATSKKSLLSTHLQKKMSLSIKLSPSLCSEALRMWVFSN